MLYPENAMLNAHDYSKKLTQMISNDDKQNRSIFPAEAVEGVLDKDEGGTCFADARVAWIDVIVGRTLTICDAVEVIVMSVELKSSDLELDDSLRVVLVLLDDVV